VLDRVRDQTTEAGADATVSLGHRVLLRLLGRRESAPAIEGAVTTLAEDPVDDDNRAALLIQVRKALKADDQLCTDLVDLLDEAGVIGSTYTVRVSRSQGVQIGDHGTQTNTFNTPPS
jgi:hypothetical protein